jgi:hypothetical protein
MAERPYSLHQYQYGYSVPTMWTDPSGRITATDDELGDGDPHPCAIAGQHRDEAGRCVYSKEWVDASTLNSIVVGGPIAPPDVDAPLVYVPRLPRLQLPGFGAAQRRSDPFILTNPTTPDGLLVYNPPIQLSKDLIFGDCHEFDDLLPGYLTNSGSNSRNLTPEEEALVREAQAARRNVGITTGAAIAEVDGTQVHSGYRKRQRFEQRTSEVLERAKTIRFTLPTDSQKDGGIPGQWAASHAEKQAYEVAPGKPIGVSKVMCGAGRDEGQCYGYFQALSKHYQQTNVVADPYTVYIFRPDGTVISIRNTSNTP